MELIYLYIRKYEKIFENEEFNFSTNYKAVLKDRHLFVDKNEEAVKGFYGKNVDNVVMFLGQNGMGKSTLLDILGMKRDDRCKDTYESYNKMRRIKSSYFLLYHLYDDYFGFEFVDDSFIRGDEKIENIDMQGDIEGNALYKLPMGTIFKLEEGVFKYCNNIILQWLGRYARQLRQAVIFRNNVIEPQNGELLRKPASHIPGGSHRAKSGHITEREQRSDLRMQGQQMSGGFIAVLIGAAIAHLPVVRAGHAPIAESLSAASQPLEAGTDVPGAVRNQADLPVPQPQQELDPVIRGGNVIHMDRGKRLVQ